MVKTTTMRVCVCMCLWIDQMCVCVLVCMWIHISLAPRPKSLQLPVNCVPALRSLETTDTQPHTGSEHPHALNILHMHMAMVTDAMAEANTSPCIHVWPLWHVCMGERKCCTYWSLTAEWTRRFSQIRPNVQLNWRSLVLWIWHWNNSRH